MQLRYHGLIAVTLAMFGACSFLLISSDVATAAPSSINKDHAKVAQLEQKIALQGQQAEVVVAKYDAVAAKLAAIDQSIATEQIRLKHDRVETDQAATHLRAAAVDAYVNAQFGNSSTIASYTGTANATSAEERNVYLNTANADLISATAVLENDKENVVIAERILNTQQSQTAAVLNELKTSRDAANQAVNVDEATLSQVSGNLLALVNAANLKREEAREEAAERAIAEATAEQSANQSASSTPLSASPTPGKYDNPLRGMAGLSPERIDQGVDYQGYGPIFAVGDGTVISTYNGGWPGGTFISYQLTDGPANGLVVYAAEDIEPTVSVGEHVTAATRIGTVYEGWTGIETGWADSSGDGTTMAADNDQYYGSNSTAFGANFSQLLSALGAPGGVLGYGPVGHLPASWPTW